tara:strand:- start:360 stop:1058 length:699 start_codon:yes stop_codon:yes gene_type:complete
MGIINVTPDSFFGDGILGSKKLLEERFLKAKEMNLGFLDIGCMSSKPNFKTLGKSDELDRLDFFLNNMSNEFTYSIDSSTLEVVDKAIDSGFSVINDVSGFQNQEIINKAIDSRCGIILVHRHPMSDNIHEKMDYQDIVAEVKYQIDNQISELISLGINESQIAIDPALGFGKKLEDSAMLLMQIEKLVGSFPVVIGYSNKKFTSSPSLFKTNLLNHSYNSGVSLIRLHIDK